MALQAAEEAIARAAWTPAICRDERTGLFVATSKGPVEAWLGSGPQTAGLGQINVDLAGELKFGAGPRLTLSAACASGLHALIRAALAIAAGEADRVLVVAVEASVHPLFISSFQRLGVLAPEGVGCRPFDLDRRGFVMSESAAAVCLESAAAAVGRPLACVDRWAIGGDATHLTAGDPAAKTLRRLLRQVVGGGAVDLVHAHGTGTIVHDPVELAAIASMTGLSRPILYSHKAALGHSLGAAGLVSVVLNCLCHRHGKIPGNIRSPHPLPMQNLQFSTSPIAAAISRSIAIASGFGGSVAAVSLACGIGL
jgi:3-oxoacyl-[acyl-carrier-protein] synthase II